MDFAGVAGGDRVPGTARLVFCITYSLSDRWPGDTELSDEIPEHVDEEGPAKDDDDVKYCQQHQGPVLKLPCFEGRPSNNLDKFGNSN